MNIVGIIPARYASTRFPGKPLIDIGGKSMIQRVYERASSAKSLGQVVVATDDTRIFDHLNALGARVIMTGEHHRNGTERCGEIAKDLEADYYINIQGDEPFIHPEQIDALAQILDGEAQLGTLVKEVDDSSVLDNPNVMKVVLSRQDEALYFSRQAIPYVRNEEKEAWLSTHTFFKHIGIYAYRRDVLQEIINLPMGELERAESLEQLRWLEHGYRIRVAKTIHESHGVDVPEDVDRVLKLLG